jgi:Mg2+/citrate symporter
MINKKTYHHIRIIFIFIILFFSLIKEPHLFSQTIRFFPDTIFACKTDSIKLAIPSEILSKSLNIQWITPYSII